MICVVISGKEVAQDNGFGFKTQLYSRSKLLGYKFGSETSELKTLHNKNVVSINL